MTFPTNLSANAVPTPTPEIRALKPAASAGSPQPRRAQQAYTQKSAALSFLNCSRASVSTPSLDPELCRLGGCGPKWFRNGTSWASGQPHLDCLQFSPGQSLRLPECPRASRDSNEDPAQGRSDSAAQVGSGEIGGPSSRDLATRPPGRGLASRPSSLVGSSAVRPVVSQPCSPVSTSTQTRGSVIILVNSQMREKPRGGRTPPRLQGWSTAG